jgi:hypothetical protein
MLDYYFNAGIKVREIALHFSRWSDTSLIIVVVCQINDCQQNRTRFSQACMTTTMQWIIVVHVGVEVGDGVEAEDHGGHHAPEYCCSRWR